MSLSLNCPNCGAEVGIYDTDGTRNIKLAIKAKYTVIVCRFIVLLYHFVFK